MRGSFYAVETNVHVGPLVILERVGQKIPNDPGIEYQIHLGLYTPRGSFRPRWEDLAVIKDKVVTVLRRDGSSFFPTEVAHYFGPQVNASPLKGRLKFLDHPADPVGGIIILGSLLVTR